MSMKQTEITAHLDIEITPGKNLLYCATFQIVWNQLVDEIIHAPIALEGNPVTAQALNKRGFEKNELTEACYLAIVGFGRDGIIEKIERGLKEKFGREPGLELRASANDILSYTYLEKNLPFDTAFDIFDEPIPFNDGAPVQWFGIFKGDAAADQVVVLDYTDPDDFIIKLQASPKVDKELVAMGASAKRTRITDEVILAKVSPESTLQKTVNTVFRRIGEEKYQKLMENPQIPGGIAKIRLLSPKIDRNLSEGLLIPRIEFDILHHFASLEDRQILNQSFEHYSIAQAIQTVKFRLGETGAVLISEAATEMLYGMPAEEPRRFIFDRPFLFCLREKDAQHPYLLLWIDNSELLVKFS